MEIEFKFYIEYPDRSITSNNPKQQFKYTNNPQFAKAYFEVQDGVLYRKSEAKVAKNRNTFQLLPCYIAQTNNAFQFFIDIHRNLKHFSIHKNIQASSREV
jgi:hypothetical protein